MEATQAPYVVGGGAILEPPWKRLCDYNISITEVDPLGLDHRGLCNDSHEKPGKAEQTEIASSSTMPTGSHCHNINTFQDPVTMAVEDPWSKVDYATWHAWQYCSNCNNSIIWKTRFPQPTLYYHRPTWFYHSICQDCMEEGFDFGCKRSRENLLQLMRIMKNGVNS